MTETMELCSLDGPVHDLIKRLIDQVGSEKNSLALKCRSIEDQLNLLKKQLEASEKYKSEYLKRYEDAINDKKKLADDYMNRITNLQGSCSSLDERCSSLKKTLEQAKQESLDWKRKYETVLSKLKAEEDQANSEISVLKSRTSAAEARLAAAREQAQSAQEEAEEWKRKFDIALRDAKAALEKAALAEERTNKNESSITAVDGNVFSRFSHRKETEGNNLSTAIKNNISKLRFQCANHSTFSRKKTN